MVRAKAAINTKKAEEQDQDNNTKDAKGDGDKDGEKKEEEEEPEYKRPETFKGIHEELSWMVSTPDRAEPYEPEEEGVPYKLDEELFYDYVIAQGG